MKNFFSDKAKVAGLALFLLVVGVYVVFTRRGEDGSFLVHEGDYFTHLAQSFVNGRLDLVDQGNTHDLSLYKGRWYMYWGPTPVFAILPFLLFFGFNFSDSLYTAIIGSINCFFLYLILTETERTGLTNLGVKKKVLLCLMFAIGSVHFVLSTMGGAWFTSQVVSIFYIFIAIYLMLKYSNGGNVWEVVFSALFFSFGAIGRNTLVFYLPFLLLLIALSKKKAFKNVLIFLMVAGLFFLLSGVYNYMRFGSCFESGYSFHNMAGGFAADKEKFGVLNTEYFKRNFYYMFQRLPEVTNSFPFVKFDPMGNSIFATSPFFILLFLVKIFGNWSRKKFAAINLSLISASLAIVVSLLFFFGTGYWQFGYRYLLDAYPLIFILLAQIINKVDNKILIGLLGLSAYQNFFGRCVFLKCEEGFSFALLPAMTLYLGLLLGILTIRRLSFFIKQEFSLFYAFPLGFIFLTGIIYFVSKIIGFSYGWILGLLLISLGLFGYLFVDKPELDSKIFYGFIKDKVLLALLIIVAAVSWTMFDTHVLKNIDGNLYVGESTYGDLPFHLGIISEMAYADNFPPENPLYKGTKLAYPYFVNLFSAVLVKGGWSLRDSIIYPGMILMLSLTVLIYDFTLTLTKSRLAAFVATILYFFHGGTGFYYFVKENGFNFDMIVKAIINPTAGKDYSHVFSENIQWANFVTRMMVPERSLLFGIPAGIIILRCLIFRETKKMITSLDMAVSAVLIGLMPIMHTHTALSFAFILPFLCLFTLERKIWRKQLVKYVMVAGLAFIIFLPFLPMFIGHIESSTGFFKIHLWWMKQASETVWQFWFKNTYIYIPLSILALIFVKNRDIKLLQAAGVILFVVLNLVQFSPFDWDNVKFLFWAGLFWAMGAGVIFAKIWHKNIVAGVAGLVIFVSMILSAFLSLNREVNLRFALFDKETVKLGDFIRDDTKKDGVFLTYKHHNSPASALAGRPILMGYPGSLWVHGIDYGERERDIKEIFAGGDNAMDLLKKYKVDYTILESGDPDVILNRQFFEKFPIIYKDRNHFLYKTQISPHLERGGTL